MESFWQRNRWWILGVIVVAIGYYLFAHAQFVPLRDGLYTCKVMSVENEDGETRWLAANTDLIVNPVGNPDGEGWIEEAALVNGKSIRVYYEDGESFDVSNRLVNVPLLGSSVPQPDYDYYRSFGVSDFQLLTANFADPKNAFSEVKTYLVAECHKGW